MTEIIEGREYLVVTDKPWEEGRTVRAEYPWGDGRWCAPSVWTCLRCPIWTTNKATVDIDKRRALRAGEALAAEVYGTIHPGTAGAL